MHTNFVFVIISPDSNHFGGLGGGHYTAYALNDDGVWCNYDDSRVTSDVDPKEVISEAAYVLYYRRKDVKVGHDYLDRLSFVSSLVPDEKSGSPSEVSSSNAAQIGDDDMDVDRTTDADSHASTKSNSPMGSIDGGDNNDYGGQLYNENEDSLPFSSQSNIYSGSNKNTNNDYPLQ